MASSTPSASLQRDLGRRALFASVGGGILIFLGAVGWQNRYGFMLPLAALVIGAAFILGIQRILRVSGSGDDAGARHAAERARYLLITRLEYAGFAVALVACQFLNQMVWLIPLVAVISGLHYLALGRLLRSTSSYVKGVALCLITVVVVALAPAITPPHATPSTQVYLWWVIIGLVGGAVLWADALLCLVRGFSGRLPMQTKAS